MAHFSNCDNTATAHYSNNNFSNCDITATPNPATLLNSNTSSAAYHFSNNSYTATDIPATNSPPLRAADCTFFVPTGAGAGIDACVVQASIPAHSHP